MTTRMLLLADTHVPKRAKRLPDAVLQAIDEADVVVHAGDWVDLATVELLQSRARVLHGVHGNNDGPEIRRVLPEIARFTVEDTAVAVIHETGAATGREKRMDLAFPDTELLGTRTSRGTP